MNTTMSEMQETIEAMIDNNSLAQVLEAISLVCFEKDLHITEMWQDKPLAKVWRIAGNKISDLSDKVGC